MARFFATMKGEGAAEVHRTANRELCADFFYGSAKESIKAVEVCATFQPNIRKGDEAQFEASFFDRQGAIIHHYSERYPLLPKKKVEVIPAVRR